MFDTDMTRHLADLSKLSFSEGELASVTAQMSDIISLMDKVKEFDSEKNTFTLDAVKYKDLRQDRTEASLDTDKVLKNAKNTQNNSFVVPKVV